MIHEVIRIYGYRNKVKYCKEDRKNMVEYANKVIKIYYPDTATITRFIKIKRILFGYVSKPEYLLLFENSKGSLVAFIYKENNSEEDIDSISNQINEIIENFIMFGLRYNYIVYGLETYVIFLDNIDVGDEKIFNHVLSSKIKIIITNCKYITSKFDIIVYFLFDIYYRIIYNTLCKG